MIHVSATYREVQVAKRTSLESLSAPAALVGRSHHAPARVGMSEQVNPQKGLLRKRGRETPSKDAKDKDATLDEKSITNLTAFLAREEQSLRVRAKEILNRDLIAHCEAMQALEERLDDFETYHDALEAGFLTEVQKMLAKMYRTGVKLEAWCNSFTPPLASGGNVGISGEVQDGIYGNIHGLTSGCSEALHRALAFEKEYAVQRTKITDQEVWKRYRKTLEMNMLHDLTKSILQAQSDLMNVANSVANNLQHLKPAADEKALAMY